RTPQTSTTIRLLSSQGTEALPSETEGNGYRSLAASLSDGALPLKLLRPSRTRAEEEGGLPLHLKSKLPPS
ncbi:MAG: hypothetical protein ACKO37_01420, partial [Vampirovibrionales bacterium]